MSKDQITLRTNHLLKWNAYFIAVSSMLGLDNTNEGKATMVYNFTAHMSRKAHCVGSTKNYYSEWIYNETKDRFLFMRGTCFWTVG